MSQWTFCKTQESESHKHCAKICHWCLNLGEANSREDYGTSIYSALLRDLTEATLRTQFALIEFSIANDIPVSLIRANDRERIHNASRALNAARAELLKAHHRLNHFLVSWDHAGETQVKAGAN
jgi:hypothetical protein